MQFSDSRRAFLRAALTTTGGLAVGFCPVSALVAEPKEQASVKLNAFIELHPSGEITITAPNPELGQGVQTALPMLVAEELEADWQQIRVKHPPADEKYGPMAVGGSDSIVDYWSELRRAGAALPLHDHEWGTFDVVLARHALQHSEDPATLMQELVQAARPGPRPGALQPIQWIAECGCTHAASPANINHKLQDLCVATRLLSVPRRAAAPSVAAVFRSRFRPELRICQ